MQPIVQNQKTGCGQQTAGIHHLGDSIKKWEIHPLKIFKKNRIISSREKEQKCSTVEIKLDYLEKSGDLHQPKTSKTFENSKQNWPWSLHDFPTIASAKRAPPSTSSRRPCWGGMKNSKGQLRGSQSSKSDGGCAYDTNIPPHMFKSIDNPFSSKFHPCLLHVRSKSLPSCLSKS